MDDVEGILEDDIEGNLVDVVEAINLNIFNRTLLGFKSHVGKEKKLRTKIGPLYTDHNSKVQLLRRNNTLPQSMSQKMPRNARLKLIQAWSRK